MADPKTTRRYVMKAPRPKRGATPKPVAFTHGRNLKRPHYGKIVGRVYVGLTDEDIRCLKWFAEDFGESLGGTLRSLLAERRKELEELISEDGGLAPWLGVANGR